MSGNCDKRQARSRLVAAGITPRCVSLEEAAAFVGLSPDAFLAAVDRQQMPPALQFGRRRVWDLVALGRALDRLSGLDDDDTGAAAACDPILAAINSH